MTCPHGAKSDPKTCSLCLGVKAKRVGPPAQGTAVWKPSNRPVYEYKPPGMLSDVQELETKYLKPRRRR